MYIYLYMFILMYSLLRGIDRDPQNCPTIFVTPKIVRPESGLFGKRDPFL